MRTSQTWLSEFPSEELALQLELAEEELGNACRASSLEKNCWLCGSLVDELDTLFVAASATTGETSPRIPANTL